jgi:hypothetical protein
MAMRAPNPRAADRSARVMKWTFRRGDDTLVCELGLNRDESAYELRIDPPSNATGASTETFNNAIAAFERHGDVERSLIENGWSLESFESDGRR